MADDESLAVVLSEFARTLVTNFPIQGILDHLVLRIVDVLPITGAGVTLISADQKPHYVAASDGPALRFEQLQSQLAQGPCLTAYRTLASVAISDVGSDTRFPVFSPAARSAGLAAVFAFPLHHGEEPLGALDLYCDSCGELDERDMAVAQTLADVTSAYLINARARDDALVRSNRFHHNALHDSLTGLPNRQLFLERLEHAAQRALRSNANVAVMFADLDGFKVVNDTHGHHVGDALLLALAQRLTALLRSGDTLARFSGDEFVFLCEHVAEADAEALARRIGTAISLPFEVLGRTVSLTASIGIAHAHSSADINHSLVVRADAAMYEIKRSGAGGHQAVDHYGSRCSDDGALRDTEIRAALMADELDVAYQPIVRVADRSLVGIEALLRWDHSRRISTVGLIALAETSDLIIDVGSWTLRRACADHHRWAARWPDVPLDLAINVSARQVLHPTFLTDLDAALRTTGTDPRSLVLEVNENLLIEDSERVIGILANVGELGVRLALDDFGTGYSPLTVLSRLPVHIVKVDRCFIADLFTSAGRTIVTAITAMAHDLGFTVVAEGVETEVEHDAVTAIGCDYAQGFLYGRPTSCLAIESILDRCQLAAWRTDRRMSVPKA
ncbi:MAG: Diguanylate cyclase protein [Acidimicrobiales bacterium]|nr:Diguanylate cyclase protein [Acidimicrobiales bacterium]